LTANRSAAFAVIYLGAMIGTPSDDCADRKGGEFRPSGPPYCGRMTFRNYQTGSGRQLLKGGISMKKKYTSYDQLPLMLNAEDVQNVLGLSRAKTYQIMHSADFPLELYGKRMLVTKDKFLDWLENRAVHS